MYKLLRTCTPHINREFLKRQHQKPCQNKANTQKKIHCAISDSSAHRGNKGGNTV